MLGPFITYGLTAFGVIGSLINPYYGFLVYVSFAIIRPEHLWRWSMPEAARSSLIVGVSLMVSWVLHLFGDWRMGRAWAGMLSLIFFLIWSYVCSQFALYPDDAWAFINSILKIVLPILVGVTSIKSVKDLRKLAWVITLSQGYLCYELNFIYLFRRYNWALDGYATMGRAVYGVALVMSLAVSIGMTSFSKHLISRGIAFCCSGFILHTIFLTQSRGAMLGLIVTMGMFFIIMPKNFKHYLLLLFFSCLALYSAGSEIRQRFATTFADQQTRDWSAQSRIDLWMNCLELISEEPIFGVGPNHFPLMAERFGWEKGKEGHNLWLQLGAEIGLPGILGLFLFYMIPFRRSIPLLFLKHPSPEGWAREYACITTSAVVGFMVSSQFVTIETLEVPYYLGTLALGILKVRSIEQAEAEAEAQTATPYIPQGTSPPQVVRVPIYH